MPENKTESRTFIIPATGTKICLLITGVLLLAAAYFYWVPLSLRGSGEAFGCQSAANPPTDKFPLAVCGSLNDVYQLRAMITLFAGLLVGGLGTAFFGVTRRTQTRKVREASDEG